MADNNFFSQEEETQQQEVQTELEKIKLGEKEYSQEELSKLVGVAEQVQEMEARYNTKFDKVWPEYGRSQNELKLVKEQMDRLQAQARGEQDLDPDSVAKALEQARKIGLVTKEDFKEFMAQNFRDLYKVEVETDQLVGELNKLEREIDGADGRPKFDKVAVLEHMRAEGFKTPMKAYRDMYETQLDEWKTRELTKARAPGMSTTEQSAPGNKMPPEVSPTRDNLNKLVMEALEGNL